MKKLLTLFLVLIFQYSPPSAFSDTSVIKVGIYNNEPLISADTDGKGKGIFADILEYVARREGWRTEYIAGTWRQCLSRLADNKIDILCAIAFSSNRDKSYDFTKEHLLTNWGQLFTPDGSDIKALTNASGKRIAVLKGDIHYAVFRQLLKKFGIRCEFIETDDYHAVLERVSCGRADAGIVNRFFGMKYGNRYHVEKSGVVFNPIKIHYAVAKGRNSKLVATLDRHIVSLKNDEDSEYYRSIDRWLGGFSGKWVFPLWGKWAMAVTLGVAIFLFAGNMVLRKRSKTKAREAIIELQRRKRAEEILLESEARLSKINECFINFTPDSIENINRLTALCGELFGATCALYNCLEKGVLCAWGQWNVPTDYSFKSRPEGRICYDVIKSGSDEIVVISNLQKTDYARTDHSVGTFRLETYVGKAVKFFDKYVGSLCVGFQEEFMPSEADKKLIGIIASAIGVEGERRRTNEALGDSEEKHRLMMEAMDDATYICSSDFRIEYMNPAMVKRIGSDTTDDACHMVMHGLDEKCPWCVHEKIMRGEYINYEVASPKDNRTYHISNSPIVHKSGLVSKLTIFRDISEFKKLEASLQQAQKMEAIGTLAGGIAHDFNNILFPLVGFSEMLREDLPADSPLQGYVDEILHAAMRSKDLVKQILAFSRQGVQEKKPIKLQLIIKEVLKLLRSSIPTTIEIQQDIDSGCDVVIADSTQVHQIVMNLATNAYHAMEETGGRLNVKLEQVRLEPDKTTLPELVPGEYALITVTDTGTGIEKDVMDKIFDPYFTTKAIGKGTGLGLSVVRGIVQKCSGDILIKSDPGKGTEIQVYLPVIDRKVDDRRIDRRSEPVIGGSESILLVDDEEAIVRMEQQMLERMGYRVNIRTGSVDALEAFKANPDVFDLVVTDMTMPNMTGVQFAGQIRKIRADIPIILCTGFSDQINEEKSKTLGIQGYVIKPVIKREIAKVIRKVLDSSKES